MQNYILAKLIGRAFTISIDAICPDVDQIPIRGNIVIDTGCMYSNIPLQSIGFSPDECAHYKHIDAKRYKNGEIKASRSRGVESGNKKFPPLWELTMDDILKSPAIGFKHSLTNVTLGTLSLDTLEVKLNYDRTSSMLLGMNVLRHFEMHFGPSLIDDEDNNIHKDDYILLACPIQMTDKSDFYQRLSDFLGCLHS